MSRLDKSAAPDRHELLTVEPEDWARVCRAWSKRRPLSPAQLATVTGWAEAGRPVVVRRAAPDDPVGAIAVGLPLPPGLGKLRLAFSLPPGCGWRRCPAVTLTEARVDAPWTWQDAIEQLDALGNAVGIRPRVFGALLWQHLTGLRYLHPGSDLDLLWPAPDGEVLPTLLDGLGEIAKSAFISIDGEILTEAGGVNWRELGLARDRNCSVLVKSRGMVEVRPIERLHDAGRVSC